MPVITGQLTKKESQAEKSQQYYQRMLTSIDIIEKTLLSSLSCSRNTHRSNRKTSMKSSRKVSKGKDNSQQGNINMNRREKGKTVKTQVDCVEVKRSCSTSKKSMKLSQYNGFTTPKSKKAHRSIFNSPYAEFQSPFDDCVFDKAETVRKASLLSPLCSWNQHPPTDRTICDKSNNMTVSPKRDQRRPFKDRRQNKQNLGLSIGRQQKDLFLQGSLSELEDQFQDCLMQKKGKTQEKQLEFRQRMTELSYRIAKIREKQLKLGSRG